MGGEWGGTQLSGHQSSGIGLAVKQCIDMLKKLLKKTQLAVVAQLNIMGVLRFIGPFSRLVTYHLLEGR